MNRRHAGFTLTELLVSMALGLIILGIVGYAFHNTSRASRRAIEVIEGDLKARAVLDILQRDFGSVHPSAAMQIGANDVTMCVATETPTTGSVDEYRWVKWSWSGSTGDMKLELATVDSPPAATLGSVGTAETVIEGLDEFSITFYTKANPTTAAGTGAATVLALDGTTAPTTRPAWAEIKIKASADIDTPHILRVAIPGGEM